MTPAVRGALALALLLALPAACGAPPATVAPGPGSSASASAAPVGSAASIPSADPGARLTQRTGSAQAEVLPDARVRATRGLVKDGHTYLAAPFDARHGELSTADLANGWVWGRVQGERHGFAVVAATDRGFELLLRLTGTERAGAGVTVSWVSAPHGDWSGLRAGHRSRLVIDGAATAPNDPKLLEAFQLAAGQWFSRRSWESASGDAFFAFAGARLERLGRPTTQPRDPMGPWAGGAFPARRTELDDLMSLYTGITSVEEALQVDRGLAAGPRSAEQRTLDVATLQGIPLRAHPWPRMIAELPGGPKPVLEPLAASVPSEMLYAHFHDLRTLVALLRELDGWVSPLAQTLESASGFKSFGERYDEELGIRRSGLAEKLGNLAASGVALASSDPYWREGSDLSLVFRVKDRTLLVGALDAMAASAKAAHPGTKASSFTAAGRKIDVLASPDGLLAQHRLDLGEVIVLSNSKGAIARFAEVAAKKRKALADSGDFQYMRARYPFDPKAEDGFVFVGDAFIANVAGPRSKILEARRMAAAADLAVANHAALLFGWLEGRRPKDAAELAKSGLLRKDELAHPGGGKIALDLEDGARSDWGRPARMVSLIDLELGKVSAAERDAYARFRDGYQRYWRTYVDPIAARIQSGGTGKRLSVDLRILPLIEQSEYDDVIRSVGDQNVALPALASGLRWVLAIGKDAEIREAGDRLARSFTRRRDLALAWIGDWVAVGAADRSGLWDLALAEGEIPDLGERRKHGASEVEVIARTPVYVALHVKSRVGLAAALAAGRAYLDETAPGALSWRNVGAYRGIEITRVVGKERDEELTAHYAIAKDVLIVSLDRFTLDRQIDAVLDGTMPKSEPKGGTQTAFEIRPESPDGYLARTIAGILQKQARGSHRGAARAFEALARGRGVEAAARRAQALAWLGFEPASPHGGSFSLDADGAVTHAAWGSDAAPKVPAVFSGGSALDQVVQQLERASFSLAFEGKGDHRALHAMITWNRR